MRVKDIQFKNAEHVIEEIKSMNVKGGSPFGRAAAWAFRLACEQEEFQDTGQLQKRMEHIAQQMLDLKQAHHGYDIQYLAACETDNVERETGCIPAKAGSDQPVLQYHCVFI